MMTLQGLPRAIARDAWWLDEDPEPAAQARPATRHLPRLLALLAGLVLIGDLLFYGHAPGLSLAIYAFAIFAATRVLHAQSLRLHGLRAPLTMLALMSLPVIEHAQMLSVLFLLAGLLLACLWPSDGTLPGAGTLSRALGLIAHVPVALPMALPGLSRDLAAGRTLPRPRSLLAGWALPIGGSLVLMALLLEANPILADWLHRLELPSPNPARILLWGGLALCLWPVLTPQPALHLPQIGQLSRIGQAQFGLTAQAVHRALILFNALLAVQTLMDAAYLWAGAALPPGMTAAQYAHRGAYPLLATALLAGVFALTARPFLAERRSLKPLMLLWLAQNVALTVSALLRLDQYVGFYGLTYLRLYAAIWMAMVALGLTLTLWQILRGRSNLWLMTRSAALGLITLYLCCFVNFAGIIARWNLAHPNVDLYYTCSLGPMAAAEIARHPEGQVCVGDAPTIEGWRDWGFRSWRVSRYITDIAVEEVVRR
ncbi:DUF4153 domain-containing protein [Gemmobacter serpentinus]|uniref:DUF4153 domain-containing protein n=1 Tax=Gemmobacter serpentinus TaxID=2652247 RepID=UPI001CF6C9A8|nr:DUF4173 domain-containing protein [Gemmobacter serpentinus]